MDVESSNLAQTPSVAICFPVLPQISGAYGIGNGITALLPSGEVCNGFPLDQLPICIYIRMIKRFSAAALMYHTLPAHKYHCRNQTWATGTEYTDCLRNRAFPKECIPFDGLLCSLRHSADIRHIQTE